MTTKTDGIPKSTSLKRFISKFITPKSKSGKKKEIQAHYDYCEFDAVPDAPRPETKLPNVSSSSSNEELNNKVNDHFANENDNPKSKTSYENLSKDFDEKFNQTSEPEEEDKDKPNFTSSNSNRKNQPKSTPNSKGFPSGGQIPFMIHQTSVTVENGTNLHFGNVYQNNVNNIYKMENKQPSKYKATKAVKELLESTDKIEAAYLQLLSTHLGNKWKDIGTGIGVTHGELDHIKMKFKDKDIQEKAFQMLKLWWQKRGESATIGSLCKKLWSLDIVSAKEAVEQLSLHLNDLK